MAAGLAVDRADIEACAATDAAKNIAALGRENIGASVVDEDDVHLFGTVGLRRGFRTGDELSVNGELLGGARSCEQVEQKTQVFVAWDEFFDPDERDVTLGGCETEPRIALVGD